MMVGEHRRTVNIHVGRKLSGKSRDEILDEIVKKFEGLRVMAVQQFPDVIRVTFNSEDTAVKVLNFSGVRLFDMWCRTDGGPPSTMVHLFDYPYEEDAAPIDTLSKTYGKVKGIRHQKYISREDIFTGTRLIDIVIERTPLDWFQLTAISVGFGIKANRLFVTLVALRVIKLMIVPTRISAIVVVKQVILPVIVLMPGVLGPLMFRILLRRALPTVPTLMLVLIVMLLITPLLRVPQSLSLIRFQVLLLLMVLEMLFKILLPRVPRFLRLSWIQGLFHLMMLIMMLIP